MGRELPREVWEALGHAAGGRERGRRIAELSTTVFGGTWQEWIDFLALEPDQRVDGWYELVWGKSGWKMRSGEEKRWPEWLERGWRISSGLMEQSAGASWFGGVEARREPGVILCSAPQLPGSCLVERWFTEEGERCPPRLLWNTELFQSVGGRLGRLREEMSDEDFLGEIWPVLRLLWLQFLYSASPRDHFMERIAITVDWVYLHLQLLFEPGRELRPNRSGKIWEAHLCGREGVGRELLGRRFPFWRLLQQVSFLRSARNVEEARRVAAILVRDCLDGRYLRLGVADLMPSRPAWLESMPFVWKGPRKIFCTQPQVGNFGIVDGEDLAAWKKVRKPFEQAGFQLIGQLGMGQFGRVYEAVNLGRGDLPERVALKVDRIRKGFKKEAIEAAETIMEIGRDLAHCPHVIRIFDAGNLKGVRFTYHVLQLVEGDTLDHLLGIAGEEHASMLRPGGGRRSEPEIKRDFLRALGEGQGEAWRKARQSPPFLYGPNLRQLLDLLTSTVLWIEEVHAMGYAVNDLKNGNLMINRRGQFKAIDLDSYSRIGSSLDKLADFFFLGISTFHLLTGRFDGRRIGKDAEWMGQQVEEALRLSWWEMSEGGSARMEGHRKELSRFLSGYLEDCRSGHYARVPDDFSQAVDRLLALKHAIFCGELILD